MKRMKAKKSQQLIEFLLIAPFLIIFLGILTEYAYALNINMTLTQGLKEVTSSIYSKISPTTTAASIEAQVKSDLTTYLQNNNVPTDTENNLRVTYTPVTSQCTIFMAGYIYYPAFSLPKMFFRILPDHFNFLATIPVPTAFLASNNYNNSIDSTTLDKVWSSTADFSKLDSFDSSKEGVLKCGTDARNGMLFLFPNSTAKALGYSKMYALVTWTGSIIKSGALNYNVNLATGKINTCSNTLCSATPTNFIDYINSYKNIIIINDPDANDIDNISSVWAYDSPSMNPITVTTSTDLSASSTDGVLKRSIAMITPPSTVFGNYDNLSYTTVYTLGSIVLSAPNIDDPDVQRILPGAKKWQN